MNIQLFNSLTQKKEKFNSLKEGKVKFYVCGPTVYNYIHIGNARPAVVFDTIRRYLEYSGYEVKYISNFTDIDDRLVNNAREKNVTVKNLTDKYIEAYFDDIDALNIKRATFHPKVTENIEEIINFIDNLIKLKFAYVKDGDVYFSTKKFPDYGKLSDQPLKSLYKGVRKQLEKNKENEVDFALWKRTKDSTELHWDSPWGIGRPGWHIECSTMIKKYLGESIDIHAGGIDLKFPHHENEIAQSEAFTGKKLAKYWLHNEFVNIDNEKMSKSLGNSLFVKDIRKNINPAIIRFWLLSVHYRQPINYSDELIRDAFNSFEKIATTITNLNHRARVSTNLDDTSIEEVEIGLNNYREKFIKEMNNDFNTANAISEIFNIIKSANTYLNRKNSNQKILKIYLDILKELTEVLGLKFAFDEENLSDEIKKLIKERNLARKNKDFLKSDTIRRKLEIKGVIIEDTLQGTRIKSANNNYTVDEN